MKYKAVYAIGNMFWVKLDSSSPYKATEPLYILMYGSGGINLSSIRPIEEVLKEYPNGEWFDRAKPDNFN